jgi:hypothetical protein
LSTGAVIFLDGDDCLTENSLDVLLASFNHVRAVSDDVVGSFGTMRSVSTSGARVEGSWEVRQRAAVSSLAPGTLVSLENLMSRDLTPAPGGILLDTAVAVRAGGFDEYRYRAGRAEDFDFVTRCAQLGSFVATPDSVLDYRVRSDSASEQPGFARWRSLSRLIALWRTAPARRRVVARSASGRFARLAREHWREGVENRSARRALSALPSLVLAGAFAAASFVGAWMPAWNSRRGLLNTSN